MEKARTLVGLDVHAAKVVAAILDSETGEARFQRLGGESVPVVKRCSSLEGPVRATEKVKTDRRDAEHLVRLLMTGKLHPVRVPGPPEEALRDLVRAREDIRQNLMRARHRLSKLLLRPRGPLRGPGLDRAPPRTGFRASSSTRSPLRRPSPTIWAQSTSAGR